MTVAQGSVQEATVSRMPDGVPRDARVLRGGEVVTAAYVEALSFEGRVFAAHMGQVTTPLVTAATTALALSTPHAWIRVPSGTTIIPVYARIVIETTGATTQGEAAVIVANNDVGNGTSSAADLGPTPLNTQALVTSNCTARQLATGAVTTPTSPQELSRFSFAASSVNQIFQWDAKSLGVYAVLRGPATWALYLGGNAVNYFAQMVWAEIPSR